MNAGNNYLQCDGMQEETIVQHMKILGRKDRKKC